MKKVTTLILAASTFVAVNSLSFAQTATDAAPAAETPSGSWVLTPTYVSQYMFRGTRLGGQSFQPSIEYDRGALAVGVWSNFPMADKVPGQSDPEFDFYGAYTITANSAVTVVPGFTYYAYPDADKSIGFYKATFEPSLALNYTTPFGLKLTPKLYYDVVLDGLTAELTGAYAVPLTAIGSELDFTATIGDFKWSSYAENTTPDIRNYGNYWLIGVAAPFQITKESKLTIGLAYTKGWNNFLKQQGSPQVANSAAVEKVVFSVSYGYTF